MPDFAVKFYDWARNEGRKAAEAKLKELIAQTEPIHEIGAVVRDAVLALPDRTKWNQLPIETQEKLEAVLVKLEINHHAAALVEAVARDYVDNR